MHKQATKNNYLPSENKSDELIVEGPPRRSQSQKVWDYTIGRILPKKRGYYVRKKIPFNKITYGQKAWDKYKKMLEKQGLLDRFGYLSYIEKPQGELKSYKDLLKEKQKYFENTSEFEKAGKIKDILDSANNNKVDLSQYYIYDIKKIKIDESKEEFFDNIEEAFTNNTEVAIPTALENREFVTTKFLERDLTGTNEFEGLNLLNKKDETHKIVKGNKKQDWGTTSYVVKQTELEKAYNGRFVVRNILGWVGGVIAVGVSAVSSVQLFLHFVYPPAAYAMWAFEYWMFETYILWQKKIAKDTYLGNKSSTELINDLCDDSLMSIMVCPADDNTDYANLCTNIIKTPKLTKPILDNFMSNFNTINEFACVYHLNMQFDNGIDKGKTSCFWQALYNKNPMLFDSVVRTKINDCFKLTNDTINELMEFEALSKALNEAKSPRTKETWFPNQKRNESLAKQFAQMYPCFISKGISDTKFDLVNVYVPSKDKNYHPLILFNSKYYSEYGTCIDKSDYHNTVDEFLKLRDKKNTKGLSEDEAEQLSTLSKSLDKLHDSLVKSKTAKCPSPCKKR